MTQCGDAPDPTEETVQDGEGGVREGSEGWALRGGIGLDRQEGAMGRPAEGQAGPGRRHPEWEVFSPPPGPDRPSPLQPTCAVPPTCGPGRCPARGAPWAAPG